MPAQHNGLDACAGSAPLAGFWLGGFEGADHVNGTGTPLDMVVASGHLARLDEDHRRARQAGLAGVRESIGWRLAEDGAGRIDLARARHVAASASRHGLQVVWTLMHYGVPEGLNLHDDRIIGRFARFAAEVARQIGLASARPPVFNLVNEISFLAWAASHAGMLQPPNGLSPEDSASQGDAGRISGYAVKRRLVQAALAAMAAVRAVDPRTRFLHIDPVVHAVPPADNPGLTEHAALVRGWQWQAWDLLCGRIEPELGGHPGALDLMGLNHYHASQWEVGSERRLDWHRRDPRRLPLASLLAEVWQRYHRPLLLAETSHVGQGRARWLHDVADQLRSARAAGLPVLGLCLYPLTDRPDWQQPAQWHRSGLWHVALPDTRDVAMAPARASAGARLADPDYMQALRQWQQVLPGPGQPQAPTHPQVPTQPQAPGPAVPLAAAVARPPLLVFSHLRWGFVRHRSHQLLSRLARRWPVVVVEEPQDSGDQAAWLDRVAQGPQLEVLVPHLPGGGRGFDPAQHQLLQTLLQAWWRTRSLGRPLAWISTPMALPLAQALRPRALVLDCADELAGFLYPPPALAAFETAALAQADLVLAAGAALARPRVAAAGSRLRLLPNGADARHFRPRGPVSGSWEAAEAALLRPTALGPQLGYAGVIDERIDLSLLAALADARPHWQLVLVGPVVKIDPARLPRRPNLHWLGEQLYRVLPGLVSCWRVALVPFVDNLATRHASPLKLLEALAAGLPVVATGLPGITDLCRRAGQTGPAARVRLVQPDRARTPGQWEAEPEAAAEHLGRWLAACEAALADHRAAPPLPRALHWDRLATVADRLLCAVAALQPAPEPRQEPRKPSFPALRLSGAPAVPGVGQDALPAGQHQQLPACLLRGSDDHPQPA